MVSLDEFSLLIQNWSGSPLTLLFLLFLATFILEDLAIAGGAFAVSTQLLDPFVTCCFLAFGIYFGDLGLYGLGRLARRLPWLKNYLQKGSVSPDQKAQDTPPSWLSKGQNWLQKNLLLALFVARITPGARLPSYSACGFFALSFSHFSAIAGVLALPWTFLLFTLLYLFGEALLALPAPWNWLIGPVFLVTVLVMPRLLKRFVAFRKGP